MTETQKHHRNAWAPVFYFKHSFIRLKKHHSDSVTSPISLKLTKKKIFLILGLLQLLTCLPWNASPFDYCLTLPSQKNPFVLLEFLEDSEYAQEVSLHLQQKKKLSVLLSLLNTYNTFFSYNHRIVRIGKELKYHLIPAPLP